MLLLRLVLKVVLEPGAYLTSPLFPLLPPGILFLYVGLEVVRPRSIGQALCDCFTGLPLIFPSLLFSPSFGLVCCPSRHIILTAPSILRLNTNISSLLFHNKHISMLLAKTVTKGKI